MIMTKSCNQLTKNASYIISNICLEFDIVSDAKLVWQINRQYIGQMVVFYERLLRYEAANKAIT